MNDSLTLALLINSYSFVVLGLLALLIVGLLTLRFMSRKRAAAVTVVLLLALVSFQLIARTDTNSVSSTDNLDNAMASGKPTLVELYSNF
jgi:cell division protein FtsW (lipid II flippase)